MGEQAERYDEMADHMKSVGEENEELSTSPSSPSKRSATRCSRSQTRLARWPGRHLKTRLRSWTTCLRTRTKTRRSSCSCYVITSRFGHLTKKVARAQTYRILAHDARGDELNH